MAKLDKVLSMIAAQSQREIGSGMYDSLSQSERKAMIERLNGIDSKQKRTMTRIQLLQAMLIDKLNGVMQVIDRLEKPEQTLEDDLKAQFDKLSDAISALQQPATQDKPEQWRFDIIRDPDGRIDHVSAVRVDEEQLVSVNDVIQH